MLYEGPKEKSEKRRVLERVDKKKPSTDTYDVCMVRQDTKTLKG